jgi:hypothetical protein
MYQELDEEDKYAYKQNCDNLDDCIYEEETNKLPSKHKIKAYLNKNIESQNYYDEDITDDIYYNKEYLNEKDINQYDDIIIDSDEDEFKINYMHNLNLNKEDKYI